MHREEKRMNDVGNGSPKGPLYSSLGSSFHKCCDNLVNSKALRYITVVVNTWMGKYVSFSFKYDVRARTDLPHFSLKISIVIGPHKSLEPNLTNFTA